MINYALPYFGEIDIANLKDYYQVETSFLTDKVTLDLNFKDDSIDENICKDIKTFLGEINRFHFQNKAFIESDFKANGTALEYLNFYLEEFDEEELSEIIDIDDKNNSKEMQLLGKLRLIRVGLYPNGNLDGNAFSIFDYSIDLDGEPCDYLLVVITDKMGNLVDITWES